MTNYEMRMSFSFLEINKMLFELLYEVGLSFDNILVLFCLLILSKSKKEEPLLNNWMKKMKK